MKKLCLCCTAAFLLAACATGPKEPGRVGQMYFTTISFDVDGDEIATASYRQIDEAVKVYLKGPASQVEVRGYTDSSGNAAANMTLSQKRAERVAKALQIRGIDKRNMHVKGYGSQKPIVSNNTPEGRQQSRRVEIEFPYPER